MNSKCCYQWCVAVPFSNKDIFECIGPNCKQYIHYACCGIRRGFDEDLRKCMMFICNECKSILQKESGKEKAIIITLMKQLSDNNEEILNTVKTQFEKASSYVDLSKNANDKFSMISEAIDSIMMEKLSGKTDDNEWKGRFHQIEEHLRTLSDTISNMNERLDMKYTQTNNKSIFLEMNDINDSQINNMTLDEDVNLKDKNTDNDWQLVGRKRKFQGNSIGNLVNGIPTNNSYDILTEDLRKNIKDDITLIIENYMKRETHQEKEISGPKDQSGWRNIGSGGKRVWKKKWDSPREVDISRKNSFKEGQRSSKVENMSRKNSFKEGQSFKRNDPIRKTIRRHNSHKSTKGINANVNKNTSAQGGLDEQMPKAVMKGIEKYREKYELFQSGGIYQPGSSNNNVKPIMKSGVHQTLSSSNDHDNKLYMISRFHERNIYETTKIYLSYLHDKPPSCCVDGITPTSCRVSLSSNGLPTDSSKLRTLFYVYHETLPHGAIAREILDKDLEAYGRYMRNKQLANSKRMEQVFSPTRGFHN